MSVVDDARDIMQTIDPACQGQGSCILCYRTESEGHTSGCPWLSMPKIVAALEAAERVVNAWQADKGHGRIPGSMGGFHMDIEHSMSYMHEKQAAEQALVAALKGEEVTA